jgi:hypothetical protein
MCHASSNSDRDITLNYDHQVEILEETYSEGSNVD